MKEQINVTMNQNKDPSYQLNEVISGIIRWLRETFLFFLVEMLIDTPTNETKI